MQSNVSIIEKSYKNCPPFLPDEYRGSKLRAIIKGAAPGVYGGSPLRSPRGWKAVDIVVSKQSQPLPSALVRLSPAFLFHSIVTGAHENSLDTEGVASAGVRSGRGSERRAHSGWMGALCLSKGLPATSQIPRRDGSTSPASLSCKYIARILLFFVSSVSFSCCSIYKLPT